MFYANITIISKIPKNRYRVGLTATLLLHIPPLAETAKKSVQSVQVCGFLNHI